MITRENYEIYFTDYLDGNLSPSDMQEMNSFLLINSDLRELLEEMAPVKLSPPKIYFEDKQSLKKEYFHECPDYYAIATAENALTEEDKKFVKHKVSDKNFRILVKTYQNLRLAPDMETRFNHKDLLYRKSKKTVIIFSLSGIAATILLILTFGIPLLHIEKPKTTFVISKDIQIFSPQPDDIISRLRHSSSASRKEVAKDTPTVVSTDTEAQIQKLPLAQVFPQENIEPVYNKLKTSANIRIIDNAPSSSEIVLTKDAETWKPSGSNVQSKNLISEMISASRNIAEMISRK